MVNNEKKDGLQNKLRKLYNIIFNQPLPKWKFFQNS